MSAAPNAGTAEVEYVCSSCGTPWSYNDVRYVACCPACGNALVRDRGVNSSGVDSAAVEHDRLTVDRGRRV